MPGTARAASILLEGSGRVTVLNEPGPARDAGEWRHLLAEIERQAPGHQSLVCSGSLPPGSPADAYAQIVAIGQRAGLRTIVDAAGPALAGVLPAYPDVVSPNLSEAESLLHGPAMEGVEPDGADIQRRAADAARGLVARGARRAIVSAGSHGAAFSDAGQTVFSPAPPVTVVSPIGAGDSLVGGLVHALEDGQDWPEAVSYAVAVASASCEQELAGGVYAARAAGRRGSARPPGSADSGGALMAKPTIHDVARLAQVSIKTVSRVTNGDSYVAADTANGSAGPSRNSATRPTRTPARCGSGGTTRWA